MLVIAFFVVIIDKTGFLLTGDIEDIIYVKEAGEETTVKPKKQKSKEEPVEEPKGTEQPRKQPKQAKPKAKPAPTSSVLTESTESVLQPNITAVTQNNSSSSLQSEVLIEPSLDLDYDDLSSFASELLKEVKGG